MDIPIFGVIVAIIMASIAVAAVVKVVTWIVALIVGLWWIFALVAFLYFVGPFVLAWIADKYAMWSMQRTYTSTRTDLIKDAQRTREQMRRAARGQL